MVYYTNSVYIYTVYYTHLGLELWLVAFCNTECSHSLRMRHIVRTAATATSETVISYGIL